MSITTIIHWKSEELTIFQLPLEPGGKLHILLDLVIGEGERIGLKTFSNMLNYSFYKLILVLNALWKLICSEKHLGVTMIRL